VSYVLAFVGFSLLILFHELGHFAAAKAVGMRAERFSLFFPPHVVKRRRGETEYCIGTIPLGGYVRITGMNPNEPLPDEVADRAYFRMPVWKRVVVIGAGPAVNVLIALLIFFALFLFVGTREPTQNVGSVERGAPAAGILQPGDRIVAVDGVQGDAEALGRQIGTHTCAGGAKDDGCRAATPAKVTIERDGRTRTVEITPRFDAQAEPPRPRLGFAYGTTERTYGPVAAMGQSASEMWRVTTASLDIFSRLIYDSEAREQLSGPVGSYEVTRQSFEFDWVRALNVLAIISLSLAIVNLFPFLPLDGGHIFWALAEKVRGRPIAFRTMERASVVGFALVMVLFVVGLTNDVGRLTGEGFNVR
jgi:regulator of sigma E protease